MDDSPQEEREDMVFEVDLGQPFTAHQKESGDWVLLNSKGVEIGYGDGDREMANGGRIRFFRLKLAVPMHR